VLSMLMNVLFAPVYSIICVNQHSKH